MSPFPQTRIYIEIANVLTCAVDVLSFFLKNRELVLSSVFTAMNSLAVPLHFYTLSFPSESLVFVEREVKMLSQFHMPELNMTGRNLSTFS